MRPRRQFDVACKNPSCPHWGKVRDGNFVVSGNAQHKNGAVILILKCDCGKYLRHLPPALAGSHQLELSREEQFEREEKKTLKKLADLRRQEKSIPRTIQLGVTMDASFSLGLYLIAKGHTIEDVARCWSLKPKKAETYAPMGRQPIGELYLLLLRARPLRRGEIDWSAYKATRRKLQRWVTRAVSDPTWTLSTLSSYINRPRIPVMTWKQYRRAFKASEQQPTSAFKLLVKNIVQPLTPQEIERNLFRRYRNLQPK